MNQTTVYRDTEPTTTSNLPLASNLAKVSQEASTLAALQTLQRGLELAEAELPKLCQFMRIRAQQGETSAYVLISGPEVESLKQGLSHALHRLNFKIPNTTTNFSRSEAADSHKIGSWPCVTDSNSTDTMMVISWKDAKVSVSWWARFKAWFNNLCYAILIGSH